MGSLQDATAALGEAIAAPELWPGLLQDLATALGATGAAIISLDGIGPVTPSVADGFAVYVEERWYEGDRDPRKRAIPVLAAGGVVLDTDIMAADEAARAEMYRDLLVRSGLRWWAGVPFGRAAAVPCLSLQRTPAEDAFTEDDRARLHLVARRLDEVAAQTALFGDALARGSLRSLEDVGECAIALDSHGRVVALNAGGAALLGGSVHLARGILRLSDRAADRAVAALLPRLGWRRPGEMPPATTIHARGTPALAVRVVPVEGGFQHVFGGAVAILVLRTLDRPEPATPVVLREAFALTPAEARVAARLAAGESLDNAADALGIARETARRHLKAVFGKTGTGRQGELVALLSRLHGI
jgi:DNA-binding CsgD family transcriptional regulator